VVVTWPGPVGPSAFVWAGGNVVGWCIGGRDPPRSSGRVVEVVVTWPGPVKPSAFVLAGRNAVGWCIRWPGPSALEREGGGGGGDVAWSRRTVRVRMGRREGGGVEQRLLGPSAFVWAGGNAVGWCIGGRDPPRSSGRVVEVEVTRHVQQSVDRNVL
jgi:hypothetical protein